MALPQLHRFQVGQSVSVAPSRFSTAPEGRYRIVRVLPLAGINLQYRVKSDLEACERVVEERQLTALAL